MKLVCEINAIYVRYDKTHSVRQKYPLKLIIVFFSATAWNLSAKYHTLITCLYLHKKIKRHSMLSYCCKVTEFSCETTSRFCTFKNLVL